MPVKTFPGPFSDPERRGKPGKLSSARKPTDFHHFGAGDFFGSLSESRTALGTREKLENSATAENL
jgi:hypothetical protein